MDNGFSSDLFEIKRGIRQGDPLSPYLFIIALEILNVAIRKNKEIEGIALGRNEIKLNAFADNLTTFVKNTKSFHLLVTLLEGYGKISGLKCYYDQKFMSRIKQKCVLYSLSDVAVPVLVTEMKFGPRKLKILNLEKWCFSTPPL